ncbi:hypothetical protein PIB30_090538 [Stylosanthes scabra]|uniref:Uncharacterized protein n=1 Tax=Stylosanthes scabra TaxID=79078 RepID=A0ABU6SUR5_9FABA|nr:hypothetical protein [Stylosanthes scabra]
MGWATKGIIAPPPWMKPAMTRDWESARKLKSRKVQAKGVDDGRLFDGVLAVLMRRFIERFVRNIIMCGKVGIAKLH